MSVQIIRLKKEARAIFWPWFAIVLARFLLWVPGQPGTDIFVLARALIGGLGGAFWIGMPLLAAVPLGMEFQHRTELLLFSQPIGRREVWHEKWLVMVTAIVSAGAIYSAGPRDAFAGPTGLIIAAIWVVVTICSAAYWALTARFTLGGMTLILLQGWAMVALWQLIKVVFRLPNAFLWQSGTGLLIVAVITLGYAFLMLILGRRKLMRFQMSNAVAGDTVAASGDVRVGFLSRILQCRPTGAVLNLVRKEVRLLYPAWSLMIICFAGELLLAALQFLTGTSRSLYATLAGLNILSIGYLGIVLAGSISAGEERSLRTQSSNMTLPLSAGVQWAVKLAVIFIGSFLGLALSTAFAELAFGEAFLKLLPSDLANYGMPFLFVVTTFVGFAAFWSSSITSSTVRGVLLLLPGGACIGTALNFGMALPVSLWRTEFANWIISRVHPFPVRYWTWGEAFPWLLFSPFFVLGVIQTYRLFRTETDTAIRSIAWRLVPVLIVAFAGAFAIAFPGVAAAEISEQTAVVLREVSRAVHNMEIDPNKLDAGQPLQLTLQNLARRGPISDRVRYWLEDRPITITPKTITRWGLKNGRPFPETHPYYTTVHLRNDWTCWTVDSSFGPFFNTFGCTSPHGAWASPPPDTK